MELGLKHRKVQEWLDNLYAGKPVPTFERNERTVELLYQLMLKNQTMDHDTQLITQDLQQKATEYTAEGERLSRILASLNLTTGSLSQSGVMTLRTLANLAWFLEIRDTSDTSYLLALKSLQDKLDRVHEDCLAEEKLLVKLTQKTKDALIKHNSILKSCKDLEDTTTQKEATMEKRLKQTEFLKCKAREYAKLVSELTDKLSRTGVDSSLFHENLVKKAQELQKLEDELEPLKKKIQDYHQLPPDISQAKIKLSELRSHLEYLEKQLSRKIDLVKS